MYVKYIKRILDILISIIAIIILSPIMIIISVIIKIKLGTPIIFKQERPGKDGKIFTLYKFRTMKDIKDENGRQLPDEKRIDKFGKFLRNYSLDELPELINILKGDMSIVGPRPLIKEYINFYKANENKRHCVRPGLTGLSQISGRNLLDWDERLSLDLIYVDNINFWTDFKICMATIKKVIKKEDVVMVNQNPLKDLNKERQLPIKEMSLEEVKENKEKIIEYFKELNRIAQIDQEESKIYENLIKFKQDGSAKIIGAYDIDKKNLVGILWCYKRENKIHINRFFIEEKYRKCGLGKQMLQEAEKYAKDIGAIEVELCVYAENISALRFYKKQKFKGDELIYLCKKI